jgi:hypothetical protein
VSGKTWALPWPDRFGVAWQTTWPGLGPWLAGIETRVVADEIADVVIDRPVFIAGLPRSGSTILLEILAAAPGFTAHRYADFPLLWTPYWWNWLRQRLPLAAVTPTERAHRDRITVNRDSPEAFEEPLWQWAFPHLHQETASEILDGGVVHAAFEQLFSDHLRKLLRVRGARRYVAKGNYGVLRLGYLARMFPDAVLVVPVREPIAHVGSLVKQERLYAAAPDHVLRHIGGIGHHEFGARRRLLHLGDAAALAEVRADFAEGRLAQGWLRNWLRVYGWLADLLDRDAALAARVHRVDYDALCAQPAASLLTLAARVGLADDDAAALSRQWAPRLSAPDYYRPEPMHDVAPALIERARTLHRRLCGPPPG